MEDIDGALEHGDPREIWPGCVMIDTWACAASQSEDVILPQVHSWVTQRAHPRVGHPGTDEALAHLGSFTRSQELAQVVEDVRTNRYSFDLLAGVKFLMAMLTGVA